jgi:hypothetical protein
MDRMGVILSETTLLYIAILLVSNSTTIHSHIQ